MVMVAGRLLLTLPPFRHLCKGTAVVTFGRRQPTGSGGSVAVLLMQICVS